MERDPLIPYIPGTCNIGSVEIRRRYRMGFMGLGAMIVMGFCFNLLHLSPIWKLLIFIPGFYMLSGFLQAWGKFCYVYGFMGKSSMTGRRDLKTVTDPQALQYDQHKALRLLGLVLIGDIALTFLYYCFL